MKIGLDTSAVGLKSTGTSRYIKCLRDTLKKTDHTIKLFSPEQTEFRFKNSFINSIPFIKRGGIKRHLYSQFELTRRMHLEGVNCGIFPNYLMPLNFDRPAVIIIHDLSYISHPQFYSKGFVLYYTSCLKKVLSRNPIIATISEYSKKCIQKYLRIEERNIYLLQAYIDGANTRTKSIPSKEEDAKPYFLYVGHIEPRKNLSFLVRNFVEWREESGQDYKLKLAGEVWTRSKETKKLLSDFKGNRYVEFLGYVTDEKIRKLYSNAAGFIHTGIVEGFGFPVLDAMNYGLPVLCSSGSGTEEISAGYAITIDPFNGEDFKRGLDRLIFGTGQKKTNYSIRYTPELMQEQLHDILSALENKKKETIVSGYL